MILLLPEMQNIPILSFIYLQGQIIFSNVNYIIFIVYNACPSQSATGRPSYSYCNTKMQLFNCKSHRIEGTLQPTSRLMGHSDIQQTYSLGEYSNVHFQGKLVLILQTMVQDQNRAADSTSRIIPSKLHDYGLGT